VAPAPTLTARGPSRETTRNPCHAIKRERFAGESGERFARTLKEKGERERFTIQQKAEAATFTQPVTALSPATGP
jgi:hypothetical protein